MQLLFPFLNGLPSLLVAQKQDRSLNFNWGYSVGYVGGTAGIVSIFRGNKFSKKNLASAYLIILQICKTVLQNESKYALEARL